MTNETLAVKYRPKKWKDVVGQDVTTIILSKEIENKSFKSAYLFVGPAGCGKTSVARLFANEINEGFGSPIEIDAASHNSVDDVRRLIDEASIQSVNSEYRVYILDEVHAFSNQAWQAMLKILEEPPKKTIFIFCTTDPQKIPNTILSRVQRFDFKRIKTEKIVERLEYVLNSEGIKNYDKEAVELIAKFALGGMRDSLTYLDKALSFNDNLTVANVMDALGYISYDDLFKLTKHLLNGDRKNIIEDIDSIYMSGKDMQQFISQYLQFILDVNTYKLTLDQKFSALPESYLNDARGIKEDLITLMDLLVKINSDIKYESNPRYMILANLLLFGEKK